MFFFSWLISFWPRLNGWPGTNSKLVVVIYFCFFWQTALNQLCWETKIEFLDPLERYSLTPFFQFTMYFIRVGNLAIFFQLNYSCWCRLPMMDTYFSNLGSIFASCSWPLCLEVGHQPEFATSMHLINWLFARLSEVANSRLNSSCFMPWKLFSFFAGYFGHGGVLVFWPPKTFLASLNVCNCCRGSRLYKQMR